MLRRPFLLLAMTTVISIQILVYVADASHAANQVPVGGRVLDALTDKPIPGAMIGVYQSGQKTARTDKQGRFRLLATPGKHIVYYDGGNPLYRSDGTTCITASVSAKGASGLALKLWKKEFAHGKVFRPTGMPLVGASVTMGGAYFTHAVTDSNGKFTIEVPQEEGNPGG